MAGSTAGASAGPPGSINLTLTSGGRSAGPSAGGVCRDQGDNIQTQYWELTTHSLITGILCNILEKVESTINIFILVLLTLVLFQIESTELAEV